MIQRCTNPKHKFYKYYGGAGVKVCERWLTFENFLADLGKRPSPKHTLSRIADSGNYKKGNVVWGDRKHQEEQRKIKNQNQRVMDPFKMPMVPQGMLCQIQA